MKTLLILRHAKSSRKDPELADHDRPLNKRGKRDAPRMGRLIRDQRLVPDLIISSTARRARLTAEAVAEACGYRGDIRFEETLYEGTPTTYVELLRRTPDEHSRVLLVGHNPGLEELLQRLTGQPTVLPTAALAHVTLPINRWTEAKADASAKIANLWLPRELADFGSAPA